MTGKSVILAVSALALSAAAGVAADPPADERRVCRGASKQLGSRIRRPRRCLTEEQWRQEDEEKGRVPLSAQITEGQNDGRQSATPQ